MTAPEYSPSSLSPENGDLALRESQYRIGFDNLIPNQANEAGEDEKTSGMEWTSNDGLERASVTYSAIYEIPDDEGVVHIVRSARLLYYEKVDPVTETVDDFTIREDRQGRLFVTEFRGMPSDAESDHAQLEYGSEENMGAHPLAVSIVENNLVEEKNDDPVNEDDLHRAMEIIEKIKSSGIMIPEADETAKNPE